jgi:hypothetical protein
MTFSTKFFPTVLIVLNLCASVHCFYAGEYRRGVYWLAAAVLNSTITY